MIDLPWQETKRQALRITYFNDNQEYYVQGWNVK